MGVQTGGSLVVPLVVWGKIAPSHTVTAVALAHYQRQVLTGSAEGQICLWDTAEDGKMMPKFMFYGHTGSITSIVSVNAEKQHFVSADDTGELCLWDAQDGRCLETKKSSRVHTTMQAYKIDAKRSISLICNGHYPEILILNPDTLDVMYSLVARIHPDWVNALCCIRPIKRNDDVILAITNSGTIKMWSINIHTVNSLHVYEDESKQIRCVDAKMLRCCPYNQRTVLIVCSKYWQIYDAGEFSLLCNESASGTTQWSGGDFIAIDKVIVWNTNGQAFLYKLPTNKPSKSGAPKPAPRRKNSANSEHGDYHNMVGNKAMQNASASLYCVIDTQETKVLPTPSLFVCQLRSNGEGYILLRADSDASLYSWKSITVPKVRDDHTPTLHPDNSMSLAELWQQTQPMGLLDNVVKFTGSQSVVTCSLFIENSGRLICGLGDGTIVIIPVMHTLRMLLLSQTGTKTNRVPLHKVLSGHKARVNCLMYPHSMESRYNPNYLLSGSSDFSVKLWDLSLGQPIHSFCVHAGEVTSFYIPPPNCNTRILSCVCSVANDHSVALISLKEKRPLVFASRHMFPVQSVKWRPIEDYMVISCTDSTAYIWQMETGLLDRVVHGVTAVEMMKACDEAAHKVLVEENPTNPQISISQALKRRNLATFRNLAQQTIQHIESMADEDDITCDPRESFIDVHNHPLVVQGLKSSISDPDAHVLLFDTEALIVQLLCDEFGISPAALKENYRQSQAGEAGQKPSGEFEQKVNDFFSLVKEKAEGLGQTSGERLGFRLDSVSSAGSRTRRDSAGSSTSRDSSENSNKHEAPFSMEIAQTFLSLLHAWTLDSDLDTLCLKKLGLEKLEKPVSYGLLSPGGQMALMLPHINKQSNLHVDYWEISPALSTQHLLSVISLTNTLMSMGNATFIKHHSLKSKHLTKEEIESSAEHQNRQSQIKQGWSLLAALHCILLPDLVNSAEYKAPRLHLLANRWQDRCLEVREASQALLLAELRRIGADGRKALIQEWSPFMPNLIDDFNGSISLADVEDNGSDDEDEPHIVRVNNDKRRLEATAIVMLGVIGAEFGADLESFDANTRSTYKRTSRSNSRTLVWHTSKALSYLLLNPVECKLSLNAPIRRAAIDLLGRGFSVWQPYIDVSAVLLGLLEICIDADKLIPSVQTGLPLTPAADACRTARHALSLIASAQPAVFVTCMAKEVARYNTIVQNPQSGTQQSTNVLVKAKSEILRVIELLIEKLPNDVADLLMETMDVSVHCLDPNSIKSRGLQETFPALCRFPMVSYCTASRRICVGSKNGSLAFYELKQSKAQSIPFQASPTAAMILYLKASSKETIQAHQGAVAAACFSDDGKYLASYSPVDAKVHFWQTSSTSLFGSQHTKCIKSYSVPWKNPGPPQPNVTRGGRLSWCDIRTISLILPDGSESRYRV